MSEYDYVCGNCGVEVSVPYTASALHGGASLCAECYDSYEDYAYEDYRDRMEMYGWEADCA